MVGVVRVYPLNRRCSQRLALLHRFAPVEVGHQLLPVYLCLAVCESPDEAIILGERFVPAVDFVCGSEDGNGYLVAVLALQVVSERERGRAEGAAPAFIGRFALHM